MGIYLIYGFGACQSYMVNYCTPIVCPILIYRTVAYQIVPNTQKVERRLRCCHQRDELVLSLYVPLKWALQ